MMFPRRPDIACQSPAEAVRSLCRHLLEMQERLELEDAELRRRLRALEKRLADLEEREE